MSKKATRFSEQAQELHSAIKGTADLFRLSLAKEEADAYGLEVLLRNTVAGVKFEFSPQEGSGWRVVVGQLIDGQFPRHPIRFDRRTVLNRFDLRDIAALRIELIPELAGKIDALAPLSAKEMCVLLERCCVDIFQGDFSFFFAFERAREVPPSDIRSELKHIRGLPALKSDLETGTWHRRHRHLLNVDELDLGYHL